MSYDLSQLLNQAGFSVRACRMPSQLASYKQWSGVRFVVGCRLFEGQRDRVYTIALSAFVCWSIIENMS